MIAVIGEAPTVEDDGSGAPFSGPAGRLLAKEMAGAGLSDSIFWMNSVSCAPMQGLGTRVPSFKELNACLPNLYVQLEGSGASFVLLAGNVPLQRFRPDLRMAKAHGEPFWIDGRMMFPIYNPVAALRNKAWLADLRADLSLFGSLVEELRDL